MAKTPQLQALHDRLRDIDANEASATLLLRDKGFDLATNPNNATLRTEVESLEREIEQHHRERGRIEAAIHESQRRDSVSERRKRLEALGHTAASVDRAGKRARELFAELLGHIERMGPVLSELETLLGGRRQDALAVLQHLQGTHARRAGMYVDAANWRRDVVSPVIAAALWRAGLGRLGASLDPWLTISPPRDGRSDEYLKGDLVSLLDRNIARADERLGYGMQVALQSAKDEAAV